MILEKKLTKRVWFDGELWSVAQVFQPTKHDDYLLLTRLRETLCHEDGTIPVRAILIDCHNDVFYPNTTQIAREMNRQKSEEKSRAEGRIRSAKLLTDSWLSFFRM